MGKRRRHTIHTPSLIMSAESMTIIMRTLMAITVMKTTRLITKITIITTMTVQATSTKHAGASITIRDCCLTAAFEDL